jgi:type II secretory pathway pseudopilin PulG
MRTRGFTLVDLLIVLAVLALVMSILMPTLARRRQLAFRMTCANNLANIGKHMIIYFGDCDDFPRAGTRTAAWGPVVWHAANRNAAYGITTADNTGGNASITASLFLLIKYAFTSESFVCPGDIGTTEWVLSNETGTPRPARMEDCWDFGATPQSKVSYAYHMPFGTSGMTWGAEPSFAIAADRNPWMETPGRSAKPFPGTFNGKAGNANGQMYGNSTVHRNDGQNVLFLDRHVDFARRPFCSLEDDNIYTRSRFTDRGDDLGTPPAFDPNFFLNKHKKDSLLVQDPLSAWAGGGTQTR